MMKFRFPFNFVRFFLVLLSSVITYFAFPSTHSISILAWICLAPFFTAIRNAGKIERLCLALLYGLLYSLPHNGPGIWAGIRSEYLSFPLSAVFFSLFFTCYLIPFLFFALIQPKLKQDGITASIQKSACFTVFLWWTPALFRVSPAHMLHDQPLMIQLADFGGIPCILFVLLLINMLFSNWIVPFQDRKQRNRYPFAIIFILLVCSGYGFMRITQLHQQEKSGLEHCVQPLAIQTCLSGNEPISSLVRENRQQIHSALELSHAGLKKHPNADIIVWPEAPIDLYKQPHWEGILNRKIHAFSDLTQKSVLIGCQDLIADTSPAQYYNTARFVRPDSVSISAYRKNHLLPFYEYDPLRTLNPILADGCILPGTETVVFDIGEGCVIIPAICYEIHCLEHIRKGVRMGGNVIAHMANFQSFGKDGQIAYMDYAMSKFRAVEFRMPLIKACNWGYGALIQATGEVVEGSISPPGKRAVILFSLFIPCNRSLYSWSGDWFGFMLTGWLIWSVGHSVFTHIPIRMPRKLIKYTFPF
ncbi:MAG: apolipoprotein N-acyltransferase [Candidatus Omnitrophota bacterium]|jgi:apolipoprotein N-acyltransferase|nr:MAG: apolipoprotein N-acyltransferase [Candidatus Omnitrophota bacterium]